jgi:hypothetical protein
MTDTQQLGIEVLAEVQSAIDDLTNLLNTINQFPDNKQSIIDVQTTGDQEVETLKNDVDSLDNKNVAINVDDTDVKTAGTDADTLSTNLDDAGSSATILESDINSIDSGPIEDAAGAASDLGSNMEGAAGGANDASSGMDNASNSTGGVGAAAGLASLGIGALVGTAVNGAGNVSDQWGRIGVIYHETSAQAQGDWGGAIDTMTSTTGRGAGDIRGYILGMGIQGVKSKDIITSSFDAIASASGATGIPLSKMENTLEKVAATGKIGRGTLQQLGLTTDDVGMSTADLTKKLEGMTAEQRTAYLTGLVNAKYGQAGNEEYKISWQHVLDSMSRAGGYMLRILGATILPLVSGAINAASWALGGMAGWFDNLQGPGGQVIKVVVGIGVALVGLVGFLIAVASAYQVLKIPMALQTLATIRQTAMIYLNRAAKVVSAAASYAWALAQTVLILATNGQLGAVIRQTAANWLNTASLDTGIISTVASGVARTGMAIASGVAAVATGVLTAAQWLLNIALDANPIGLVVLAIAALVAAFVWAYYNIGPVKNAVDALWGVLNSFWKWLTHIDGAHIWDWIWKGIVEAGQKIYLFFQDLANFLINLPANMNKWGRDIILGLINGIVNAIPGLRQALSAIGINFPQSPPKEGPLAAVTAEGAESWTSNIAKGMTKGLSKFSLKDSIGKLPSLSGMPNVSNATGMGQGSSQPSQFNITIDLKGLPSNTSDKQAKNIGNNIGTGLVENSVLKGLLSAGGKPNVTMRR